MLVKTLIWKQQHIMGMCNNTWKIPMIFEFFKLKYGQSINDYNSTRQLTITLVKLLWAWNILVHNIRKCKTEFSIWLFVPYWITVSSPLSNFSVEQMGTSNYIKYQSCQIGKLNNGMMKMIHCYIPYTDWGQNRNKINSVCNPAKKH